MKIINFFFGRWLRERDRARQLRDAARSRYCDINLYLSNQRYRERMRLGQRD